MSDLLTLCVKFLYEILTLCVKNEDILLTPSVKIFEKDFTQVQRTQWVVSKRLFSTI